MSLVHVESRVTCGSLELLYVRLLNQCLVVLAPIRLKTVLTLVLLVILWRAVEEYMSHLSVVVPNTLLDELSHGAHV